MDFSELSLAEHDSGLSYDPETLSLCGEVRGFGVTVEDADGEYKVKVYAEAPYLAEKDVLAAIRRLAEKLPKNAVNGVLCEVCFAEIRLNRDFFLQENLPLIFGFIEKLTAALAEAGIKGAPAKPPEKSARSPEKAEKSTWGKAQSKVQTKPGLKSVKGLFGALVGAAAMTFISSSLIEAKAGSIITEIGSYVLTAGATLLIFFDYRFLAGKLDALGVIVCPVLSVLCSVLSALLATARAYAEVKGITAAEAFSSLPEIFANAPEIASAGAGYLSVGAVVSVLSSILYCIWYFRKHPDEMFGRGAK